VNCPGDGLAGRLRRARREALSLAENAELPIPRLDREYIWSPAADGSVDELIAEVAWTWMEESGEVGAEGAARRRRRARRSCSPRGTPRAA